MAKKTLRNFQVVGALFVSPGGAEIAAGDEVRLFLNQVANPGFPEYVDGIAQNPITRVNLVSGGCVQEGTSYSFEYEADDLDGAATQLNVCDVVEVSAIACCEVLRDALDAEIAARTAADTALQENIDEVQDDLDTWDVLELSAEPVDGVLGVKQITTQTVIGTVVTGGTAITTITGAGITGSPLALTFDVDAGDTPSVVAAKAAAKIETTAAVTALYEVDNIGSSYALTRKVEAANDGTLNVAITNGTCTGLTPDGTSTATQAGVATVVGTVAERVGRRATYAGRLFEARDISPNEWVEILTEETSIVHSKSLTGYTGANGLDTIPVSSEDADRVQLISLPGTVAGSLHVLVAGTDAEDGFTIVRPDNYNGATNAFVWKFLPVMTDSANIVDASSGGGGVLDEARVPIYASGGSLTVSTTFSLYSPLSGFTATYRADELTAGRFHDAPDASGELALVPQLVAATPTTGFTITAARYHDQVHYLTPAGVLATGAFNLPTAANSRAGQIIRLATTQNITALTTAVSGGGTILGTALTAAAANTPYAWQCVSTVGTGTWVRLQ